MITRVFFAARRSDLTTEACLAHWRGTHSAIGAIKSRSALDFKLT